MSMKLVVLLTCAVVAEAFTPFLGMPLGKGNLQGVVGAARPNLSRPQATVSSVSMMDLSPLAPVNTAILGAVSKVALWAEPFNRACLEFSGMPILQGKAAALIHPIAMTLLYGVCIYTAYLGMAWRRVRTMPAGDKRSDLLPKAVRARNLHNTLGAVLLGLSTLFAVEGCLNTWIRTGRLFATPHLFAGGGVAVLLALSASMVPFMKDQTFGVSWARWIHMILNFGIVTLFTWQLFTGYAILFPVMRGTPDYRLLLVTPILITGYAILERVWTLVPWQVAVARVVRR